MEASAKNASWVAFDHANVKLGGHLILRDICWRWNAGEHWVVLGETGAGKSTFLKLIAGGVFPDERTGGARRYHIDGETFSAAAGMGNRIVLLSPEKQTRHAKLGIGLTVWETVLSGFEDRDYVFEKPNPARVRAARALLDDLELTPLRLRTTDTLSQGQLRRTLLARALVGRSYALLLDEVGQGLDAHARALMQAALGRAHAQGVRILCATHRFDECGAWANRWLRIEHGRIAACGRGLPHAALAPDETTRILRARPDPAAPVLVRVADADVCGVSAARPVVLLRGVNWTIRKGAHTLITGENGAGKSTLLKLVYGDLSCGKDGVVERFLGAREPLFLPEARPRMGFLSSEVQAKIDASQTLVQAVASGFVASLGCWRAHGGGAFAAARALLRRWGLADAADKTLAEVSFGQARLALLGRAVVRKPPLLLLDEPFDGLSPRERVAMRARLKQLAEGGTTLVFATHHPAEVPRVPFLRLRVHDGRAEMLDSDA